MNDEELRKLFESLQHEIIGVVGAENAAAHAETRRYVDAGLAETRQYIDTGLAETRQYIDAGLAQVRSESAAAHAETRQYVDTGLTETRRYIDGSITKLRDENALAHEETRRHFGIVAGDLGHRIERVAEGVRAIHETLAEDRVAIAKEFEDVRETFRLSDRALASRIT